MAGTSHSHFLINGHHELALSPLDRGFAYGDGVFRTLRVSHGVPVTWSLHYNKLVEDCKQLGIVCPSADVLLADIERLCPAEAMNEPEAVAVVKIIITRGESVRGYALPALAQPGRVLVKSLLPVYPEQNSREGVALHVCKLRLGWQPQLAGIKHLNRLENVLARAEWSDNDIADGLLLDQQDNVIECTMSNLFARFGQALITPDLSQCGVAGITRQRILAAAPALGYVPEIGQINFASLMHADEVLICNSLFGVWQVRQIDQQYWPAQLLASQLREVLAA